MKIPILKEDAHTTDDSLIIQMFTKINQLAKLLHSDIKVRH
jgi:hypothetical protein